jgi:hypothetical protein
MGCSVYSLATAVWYSKPAFAPELQVSEPYLPCYIMSTFGILHKVDHLLHFFIIIWESRNLDVKISLVSMLGYLIKILPQAHGLTYATMPQHPNEFIIDMEWKSTTPENHWIE